MVSIHLIFYDCQELQFPDMETNLTGVMFLLPAEYSAVMCGAFPGTSAT